MDRRLMWYVEACCRYILASEAMKGRLEAHLGEERHKMEAEVDKEAAFWPCYMTQVPWISGHRSFCR